VQKILDYASWGFIAVLALPTVMIIATWSSVPGDLGYGVKRAFEGALLVMARPSYDAEASLNAQYTKRRMEEAKALLSNNQSSAGLSYLSDQITATKKMIDRAPTEEKKRAAAKEYIKTLQGVSKELKAQQAKPRTLAVKTTTTSRSRQIEPAADGEQLQANLQMQLEQVEALQQQLQQQVRNQQSQQLMNQLAEQARQLQQLQQQVAQGDNAQTQEQIQQITQQLNASQQQTQTVIDQITIPSDDQEPQEAEVIDTTLLNTEEQIQETIQELETIAQADSFMPQEGVNPPPDSREGERDNNRNENNTVHDNGEDNDNENNNDN